MRRWGYVLSVVAVLPMTGDDPLGGVWEYDPEPLGGLASGQVRIPSWLVWTLWWRSDN